MSKIALIGECMLELSNDSKEQRDGNFAMNLGYGGDTCNTAVYLARHGIVVDYVTALGDDPMSTWMLSQWQEEGVGCELVQIVPNAVPGLYMISTDRDGERSFYYWRNSSPARALFDDEDKAQQIFNLLANYDYLCLTGITLAIYSAPSRQRLFRLLTEYKRQGGKVIFDGNYRPRLWATVDEARAAYQQMYSLADIALPTIEDEQQLFADESAEEILHRIKSTGVNEIILKMGEHGCRVVTSDIDEVVPSYKVQVVDTTSAGDSFNAGYIAARIKNLPELQAAKSGHKLASVVIQHKGAIIPSDAMPDTSNVQ